MASKGKGRIFKRKDGKYLLYIPLKVAEDSQFPFTLEATEDNEETASVRVNVSFEVGKPQLLVTEWKE